MFENIDSAFKFVDEVCNTPAVAGENGTGLTDAHKYTRTLIKNDYPRLVEADEQFIKSINPTIEFPTLIKAIEQHADSIGYAADRRAALQRILGMITAFVNSPTRGLEGAETMIIIPKLLLRCWNLAQRYVARNGDRSFLTQILECLDGNILDQGGCMPGVVARLYPAYARLLRYELNHLQRAATPSILPAYTLRRAATEEDDDMARAIRASLATPTSTPRVNPNEDEQLALALSASLGQTPRRAPPVPAADEQDYETQLAMAQLLSVLEADPDKEDEDVELAKALSASLNFRG